MWISQGFSNSSVDAKGLEDYGHKYFLGEGSGNFTLTVFNPLEKTYGSKTLLAKGLETLTLEIT